MLVKDFDKAVELAGGAGPGSVFLVSGEEPFQALRLETVLEARARELGLETARIPGDEVQPGDIRRLASEGSLFSSGRFILVRNTDAIPAKAQPEALEAVSAPGSNHVFLFFTERTSLNTVFLKKLGAAATVSFACWEPFAGRMWPWTRRLSGELGLKLDRQASETAEALSYGRLLNLWNILERASIRYGSKTVVDHAMIVALSGVLPECSALDMSQEAVAGKSPKALEKLSLLLASGEDHTASRPDPFAVGPGCHGGIDAFGWQVRTGHDLGTGHQSVQGPVGARGGGPLEGETVRAHRRCLLGSGFQIEEGVGLDGGHDSRCRRLDIAPGMTDNYLSLRFCFCPPVCSCSL